MSKRRKKSLIQSCLGLDVHATGEFPGAKSIAACYERSSRWKLVVTDQPFFFISLDGARLRREWQKCCCKLLTFQLPIWPMYYVYLEQVRRMLISYVAPSGREISVLQVWFMLCPELLPQEARIHCCYSRACDCWHFLASSAKKKINRCTFEWVSPRSKDIQPFNLSRKCSCIKLTATQRWAEIPAAQRVKCASWSSSWLPPRLFASAKYKLFVMIMWCCQTSYHL